MSSRSLQSQETRTTKNWIKAKDFERSKVNIVLRYWFKHKMLFEVTLMSWGDGKKLGMGEDPTGERYKGTLTSVKLLSMCLKFSRVLDRKSWYILGYV